LALLEADYKVVIVDNLYNSSEEVVNRIELICGKRPEFYKVDITEEAALDKVFAEHPDIDNVIHFAALKVRHAKWRSGQTPRRGRTKLPANEVAARLLVSRVRFPSSTTASTLVAASL
jgi:nucleoside-diphosphate-sugar epimerase